MSFDAKATLRLGDKTKELRKGDRVQFQGIVDVIYNPYTEVAIDEESVEVVSFNIQIGERVEYRSTPVTLLCLHEGHAWVVGRTSDAPFHVRASELRRFPPVPASDT